MILFNTFIWNYDQVYYVYVIRFYISHRLLSVVVKPRYDIDPLGRQYILLSVLVSGFIECYDQEWYDHEFSAVKVVQIWILITHLRYLCLHEKLN